MGTPPKRDLKKQTIGVSHLKVGGEKLKEETCNQKRHPLGRKTATPGEEGANLLGKRNGSSSIKEEKD